MLDISMLEGMFKTAREEELQFVVIGIESPTGREAVVIPSESFDSKEVFYTSTYDNELKNITNKHISIFNFIAVASAELIPYVFDVE